MLQKLQGTGTFLLNSFPPFPQWSHSGNVWNHSRQINLLSHSPSPHLPLIHGRMVGMSRLSFDLGVENFVAHPGAADGPATTHARDIFSTFLPVFFFCNSAEILIFFGGTAHFTRRRRRPEVRAARAPLTTRADHSHGSHASNVHDTTHHAQRHHELREIIPVGHGPCVIHHVHVCRGLRARRHAACPELHCCGQRYDCLPQLLPFAPGDLAHAVHVRYRWGSTGGR